MLEGLSLLFGNLAEIRGLVVRRGGRKVWTNSASGEIICEPEFHRERRLRLKASKNGGRVQYGQRTRKVGPISG